MHRGAKELLGKRRLTEWELEIAVPSPTDFSTFGESGSRYHKPMAARRMTSWWSHFQEAATRSRIVGVQSLQEKPSSSSEGKRGLSRRLGVLDLILLGIGASIGAGIFVVTGTIANDTGPGVSVSFALAGFTCVANALCYAELASRFPAVVGGAYLYAYSAYNELIAFLVFCQIMLDYHIGAAGIARSLAGYLVNILELIPVLSGQIPIWFGPGGKTLCGGFFSINVLAPIILLILIFIICRGVRESSVVNDIMTITKIVIILVVIIAGAFEVDRSNWTPFAPNGVQVIVTGATVAYVSYVGFDAVANSAEESKRPTRDLPIGILVSLIVCAVLYVAVSLVITGMVPYQNLAGDAPLAEAFTEKGLVVITALISVGACAGLTTTLLVGLYVQSRLYFGLGRDGLLPSVFAKIDTKCHTPVVGSIWCGTVAGVLATLFNVSSLSHILSVGTLSGYSVVCACVLTLRISNNERTEEKVQRRFLTKSQEANCCIMGVALCGFVNGLFFRWSLHYSLIIVGLIVTVGIALPLYFRQVYTRPVGFTCPGIPTIPLIGVFVNMLLFAQLYWEGWVRFVVLIIASVGFYAMYGQYNATCEPVGADGYSYSTLDTQGANPDEA